MTRLRRSLLSLIALAVLACGTAFVSHLHKSEALAGTGTTDHCELCLQVTPAVSGTANQPHAHAPLPLWQATLPHRVAAPVLHTSRSAHHARAPPQAVTTA